MNIFHFIYYNYKTMVNKSGEKVIPELLMDLPVYETCYEGSTPYNVYINDEKGWLSVYGIPKKTIWVDSDGEEDHSYHEDLVTHLDNTSLYWDKDVSSFYSNMLLKCYFVELFEGKDPETCCVGNTMLMRTVNGSYTYIGDRIYNFTIPYDDTIVDFYSPIYNNTPYPVAIGKKNVYLMLHGVYANKKDIELDDSDMGDIYIKFYYKHNYISSNTIFSLFGAIKRIDNGYYLQCNDLIEETIIRHTNIEEYDHINEYDIDLKKSIMDQVNETEELKKMCYSIYDVDDDTESLNDDVDDYDERASLKDDLDWVSEYVGSLMLTLR